MKKSLLLLVALAAPLVCRAESVVVYTIGAGFHAFAPVSAFTAPNTSFQLQFTVPQTPTPEAGINASDFGLTTDVRYTLGSSTVVYPATVLGFYRLQSSGGLYLLLFSGSDQFELSLGGPQLYSEPASAPTMLAGNWVFGGLYTFYTIGGLDYGFPSSVTGTSVVVTQGVPEPSEGLLSAAAVGLALVGVAARTRR
ncbi:hypothetical protein F183_A35420 [Bryobacterales bacterium F-183]|nr:hypothetical protein F183_A35420 [Bryobacterales bacterium F-183]